MEHYITLKKAAERLQVSERFLRKLQAQGRLRVVCLGGARVVRVSERELERLCGERGAK